MLAGLGVPFAIVALALGVLSIIVFVARNYRKCPPNEVLVVYGGKSGTKERFVTGGGTLVMPILKSYKTLPLKVFQVEVKVKEAPNKDGVKITVDAVANVKISSDPEVLSAAAERLLGSDPAILQTLCASTLEGILRQIVGTLTVEEIVRDREKLQQEVVKGAHTELRKLGFTLDNFVVKEITDKEGYIDAMGKKRTAEVKKDAEIGEAEAKREATVKASEARRLGETARLQNEEQIAEAERNLALKKAAIKAETETADAQANLAKQLKEAEINEGLVKKTVAIEEARIKAQIGVADQEIQRKERELQATVLKPAEAERTATVVRATGEADAKVLQANADKLVMVARAEADKVRLAAEGEGHAAAEAAQKEKIGLAEAAAVRAKGEAEGAAISAKLLAEAEGLRKKNEALAQMSDSAWRYLVLDKLPPIIETAGEAAEKAIGSAFEHVGAGLSRIDSIRIVDMGGNGNGNGHSPVSRFALAVPDIVFGMMERAKALGVNLEEILKPFGIDSGKLLGEFGKPNKHHVLEDVKADE